MLKETINYSWAEFDEDIGKLASWVIASGNRPDYIVGIVRGGAIPAICLSHILHVPVKLLSWSLRDGLEKDVHALEHVSIDCALGKKILIVEDIVDSGKTLSQIKYNLGEHAKDSVKYTSLWFNVRQHQPVDWFGRAIDRHADERYIMMPWEK